MITAGDYRQVFSNPKRVSTPELLFLFSKNDQQSSRLGLAIAKKQIPRAVDRNRIKRLIRESFRVQRRNINSFDIVVMARKSVLNMDILKSISNLISFGLRLFRETRCHEANINIVN